MNGASSFFLFPIWTFLIHDFFLLSPVMKLFLRSNDSNFDDNYHVFCKNDNDLSLNDDNNTKR